MMRVSIRVSQDTATPAGERLRRALQPNQLAAIASRKGAALYTSHFEQLAAERHRGLAAASHNFYAEAARSTIGTHTGGTALITVSGPVGLRQRIQGGDIKAVNAFALFIPLPGTPAEGRTPGDFADLVVIWNASTKRGVAKEKGKDGKVLFALRDMISQAPDDTILPPNDGENGLYSVIRSAIAKRLQSSWKHDQASAST